MAKDTHRAESPFDNPITFEGIDLPFKYSNEEWSLSNLPWVRVASVLVGYDDREMTDRMDAMVSAGIAPEMLEGLTNTKDHLEALAKVLDVALCRSFMALERLGFTPESPPPDEPLTVQ